MKRLALLTVSVGFAMLPSMAAAQATSDLHVTVVGRAGTIAGATSEHLLAFDTAVGVPGVALAPGEYVFRVVNQSIIQVTTPDRSKALAAFFAVPTERLTATDDYAVTVKRVVEGAPPRIEKLFLPNVRAGYEFLYPSTPKLENPSN